MRRTIIILLAGVLLYGCKGAVKQQSEAIDPDVMAAMRMFTQVYKTVETKYLDPISADTLIDYAIAGMYEEGGLAPPKRNSLLKPTTPGEPANIEQLKRLRDAYRDVQARAGIAEGERLWRAASRRLVNSLDPHSSYIEVDDLALMRRPASTIGATGVGLKGEQGRIIISYLIPNTPAQAAGLRPGDEIVEIDGAPQSGKRLLDVVRALRGELGSELGLLIRREGKLKTKKLMRDQIVMPILECRVLENRVLYLRPFDLAKGLGSALEKQSRAFAATPAGMPDRVVVDLRNNSGGLLGEAVAVADQFLVAGTIADLHGRMPKEGMHFSATPGGAFEALRQVTVLVDGNTASGAELIAAALQDHRRARIIGEHSGGYGTVQTIFPMQDGSALKLTLHRILRPSGKPLSEGVEPDTRLATGNRETVTTAIDEATCPGSKRIAPLQDDEVLRLAVE